MTKRDLVLKIASKTGLLQKDVTTIVQMTLDGIADDLAAGNTSEFRNFGVFEIATSKSRVGRNPNKPEIDVVIPARSVVKFRTGKELKQRLELLDPKDQ